MGAWSWLRPRDVTGSADPAPPAPGPGTVRLAEAAAARAEHLVVTRADAMRDSVVNRARDLVCGTLAGLPFTRVRDRAGVVEDLGAGWLTRPDPLRTRASFVSWVTDDLFFHGCAVAWVTARDADGFPVALAWMPWSEVRFPAADVVAWTPGSFAPAWRFHRPPTTDTIEVSVVDVVVFESPVTGVLESGADVLTTAKRLAEASRRFARNHIAAGWLEQQDGSEDLTDVEIEQLLADWQRWREVNTVGYTNRAVKWNESQMDPSRLQLVEGRSFQDAAVARVCNVPNFTVGVAVPGDSMTYKTAATARLDLIDFGLAPYLACWEQTLSGGTVTPNGTTVALDPRPFLRSAELDPNAQPITVASEASK